ncbi:MAG: sugar nucleotide-binding protein, partial [bacterium]
MGRAPNWQAAEERPVVILGAGGMLATALVDALEAHEYHYVALSEQSLDITYEGRVAAILKGLHPRLIINAAAYTDVDGAETDRDLAFEVNATGARNVAAVAQAVGATALHISTDY